MNIERITIISENIQIKNQLEKLFDNINILVIGEAFIISNNNMFDLYKHFSPNFTQILDDEYLTNILRNIINSEEIYFLYNINYYNCVNLYNLYHYIKKMFPEKEYYILQPNELTKECILKEIDKKTKIIDIKDNLRSLLFCNLYEKYLGYTSSTIVRDVFGNKYSAGLFLSNIVRLYFDIKYKKDNSVDLYRYKLTLNNGLELYSKPLLKKDLVEIGNINKVKLKKLRDNKNNINPLKPLTLIQVLCEIENYLKINVVNAFNILMNLYYKGYITYPITNSINYDNNKKEEIIKYIKEEYGDVYIRDINFSDDGECIRIISLFNDINILSEDEKNVYNYIKDRCIALFMVEHFWSSTIYFININNIDFYTYISKDESNISYKNVYRYHTRNNIIKNIEDIEYDIISIKIVKIEKGKNITLRELFKNLFNLFTNYNLETHIKALEVYLTRELITIDNGNNIKIKDDYKDVLDYINENYKILFNKDFINSNINNAKLIKENKIKYSTAFETFFSKLLNEVKNYSLKLSKSHKALRCSKCGNYIRLVYNNKSGLFFSKCFGDSPLGICSCYHDLKNIDLEDFEMYSNYINIIAKNTNIDI